MAMLELRVFFCTLIVLYEFVGNGDAKNPPDVLSVAHVGRGEGSCRDYYGKEVSDGDWFKPEKDPCVQCKCDGGRRGPCMSAACAAPECDKWEPVDGVCCGYRCLPDTSGESREPVDVMKRQLV